MRMMTCIFDEAEAANLNDSVASEVKIEDTVAKEKQNEQKLKLKQRLIGVKSKFVITFFVGQIHPFHFPLGTEKQPKIHRSASALIRAKVSKISIGGKKSAKKSATVDTNSNEGT